MLARNLLLSILGTVVLFFCHDFQIKAQFPVQSIRGVVSDFGSNELLPSATLFIQEIEKGTTTNLNGEFKFEDIPIGRYTVFVSFVGYETVIVPELLISFGKEIVLEMVPFLCQPLLFTNPDIVAVTESGDEPDSMVDMWLLCLVGRR